MKVCYIFTFCLLVFANSATAQVAVIANASVPVDEIGKTELGDLYTGDIRNWSDGNPVIVLDLQPKGDVKNTFYKYFGKSTSRMKSIWLKNMLQGEGDPPESIATEDEMLEKVASTPGAIGFISEPKAGESVKILLVIEPDA